MPFNLNFLNPSAGSNLGGIIGDAVRGGSDWQADLQAWTDAVRTGANDFAFGLTNQVLDGIFHSPFGGEALSSGPSSSATPYVLPASPAVQIMSIATVGDVLDTKVGPANLAGQPYKLVGIPDGIGAYDNPGDTFTILVNHELAANLGVVREHGSVGAFVTKLTVDENTMEVVDAQDLIQRVRLFDAGTHAWSAPGTYAFGRLCSGDLPKEGAFFNAATGKGFNGLLYLNGEEAGNEGKAFAHVVTGSDAGTSYELPWLGNMSFENVVASPNSGDKTIVFLTDDTSPG
ncbi:MAG: hypothetical protein ABW042_09660, partial [Phenylobacterium sp.]